MFISRCFVIFLVLLLSFISACSNLGDNGTTTDPGEEDIIPPAQVESPVWSLLLGSSEQDIGYAMAKTDDDGLIIAGTSTGDYQGEPNRGDPGTGDILLSKVGLDGTQLWSRTLGTSLVDTATAVALDQNQQIIIGGGSYGRLGGSINQGQEDAVIIKCDSAGNQLWAIHIGSSLIDRVTAITVDTNGNIYAAGFSFGNIEGQVHQGAGNSRDFFVAKISPDGDLLWLRNDGTSSDDLVNDIVMDSAGYLYIIGSTLGNLHDLRNSGGYDIFLIKLDSLNGDPVWSHLTGTSEGDFGDALALDSADNLFYTGAKAGFAFITGIDGNNNELWSFDVQARASGSNGNAIAILAGGDIMLGGNTTSPTVEGIAGPGSSDIFILRYTSAGSLLNKRIYGNANTDIIYELIPGAGNSLYGVAVSTSDIYGHTGLGQADVLVFKLQ